MVGFPPPLLHRCLPWPIEPDWKFILSTLAMMQPAALGVSTPLSDFALIRQVAKELGVILPTLNSGLCTYKPNMIGIIFLKWSWSLLCS